MTPLYNVTDHRTGRRLGTWLTEPLVYEKLTQADIGRTVIYRDVGRAEAGTLSSFRDGLVWARYSTGDTAAAADPSRLVFGVHP